MNNFAVTSAGLGEALTRSASALDLAGNSIQETAGMVTGIVEVTQDPEKAGSALKVLSLRLRGMKGQLEELGEETDENVENISKMQGQILNMTGGKVNIFDASGNFKSTYEIMKGIAEVWDDLSSVNQADLLETIAGKHRANDVAALLSNWENVEAAVKSASEAEGSASRENAKYVDSIQGRLDKLTTAWQSFAETLMSSDFLKEAVSALTSFVEGLEKVVDTVGTLGTIGLGTGIYGIIKNFSTLKPLTKNIFTALTTNAMESIDSFDKWSKASEGVVSGGKKLASSLSAKAAAIGLVVAAVGLAVNAYKNFKEEQSRLRRETIETSDEFLEASNSFEQAYIKYSGRMNLTAEEEAELESAINGTVEALGDKSSALKDAVNNSDDYVASLERIADAEIKAAARAAREKEKNAKEELEATAMGYEHFDGSEIDIDLGNSEASKIAEEIGSDYFKTTETRNARGTWETKKLRLSTDADVDEIVEYYDFLVEYEKKLSEAKLDDTSEYEQVSAAIEKMSESIGTYIEGVYEAAEAEWQIVHGIPKTTEAYLDMRESVLAKMSDKSFDARKTAADALDSEYSQMFDLSTSDVQARKLIGVIDEYDEHEVGQIETFLNMRTAVNNNECTVGDYMSQFEDINDMSKEWDDKEKEELNTSFGLDTDKIKQQYEETFNYISRLYSSKDTRNMSRDEAYDYKFKAKEKDKEVKAFLDSLTAEELNAVVGIRTEIDWENDSFDDILKQIEEEAALIEATSFSINLELETEKLENLSTAISESVSGAGLSNESISLVEDMFGDLDGYDKSALFERTANGIRLNSDELRKLNDEYKKTNVDGLDGKIDALGERYNQTKEELYSLTYGTDEYNQKARELSDIEAQINATEILAAQYQGLASAYQEWQRTESTGSQRSMYEGMIEGFETVGDEISRGWMDDGTIEFLELIKGEKTTIIDADGVAKEIDIATASAKELKQVWKDLDKNIEHTSYSVRDFFTVDEDGNSTSQGVYNFLDAIGQMEEEKFGGKDVVKRNDKGEIIAFDFQIAGGDKAIAEALGISEELVQIMKRAADDAGFVVSMDGTYQQLDVLKKKASEAAQKLKETFKVTEHNFFQDGSEKGILKDYQEAMKLWETYTQNKNADGTIDMSVEGAEEAYTLVSTLQSMVDQLSEPVYMELNASQVEKDMQTPLSKLQEYETLVQTEHQLQLKGTDTSQIEADKKAIIDYFDELQENKPEIAAELGIEGLTREEIQAKVEAGEIEIPATIDLQVEMNSTLRDMVNVALYNAGLINKKELKKRVDIKLYADEIDTSDVEEKTDDAVEDSDSNIERKQNIEIIAETFGVNDVDDLASKLEGLDDKTIQAIAEVLGRTDVDSLKYTLDNLGAEDKLQLQVIAEAIGKGDVEGLQTAINELSPNTVEAIAKALGYKDVESLKSAVASMDGNTVQAIAQALGLSDVNTLQITINNMKGNTVDANVNTDGQAGKIDTLQSKIDGMHGTTVTIWAQIKQKASDLWNMIASGGKSKAGQRTGADPDGKGGVNGTANVNGTTGKAFARGDWRTKKTETALTGELGREIVVTPENRWYTVGDNGAEFVNIPRGSIVFNHKQTEELLRNGKATSGGGRARALVNGTAFLGGTAHRGYGQWIVPEVKSFKVGYDYKASSDKDSKKSQEIFDWIEVAIERIEREIDNLDTKANSVYRSWSERNTNLANEIDTVGSEIILQKNAIAGYQQVLNEISLPQDYINKIKSGAIDIDNITDETLAEKIKDYQKWYEKILDCKDAILELTEKENDLVQQKFDNIIDRYDGYLSVIEHEKNMLEEYINQSEAQGWLVSEKYYQALSTNERDNIAMLEQEKAELLARLGDQEKYSQQWYDNVSAIDEVTEAIEAGKTSLLEYAQSIQEIKWEQFDLLQEKISAVTEEADFLIELLSNDKLHDDSGQLTNEGLSTMGLHGQNYNTYMYQADLVAKEIKRLEKEMKNDKYDSSLEEHYREMISLQQEYILNAEDEKDAIKSLVEEGIELELDALDERIQKYEEALDSQKDLYDYQKRVEESTKNIANLRKQLSSMENDTSEEARAKIQELKISLEEAESDLQETEYDRYIQDQQQLLDELYLEYEEILNTRLDNVDALISDMIAEINANAGIISSTLHETADSVGYTLSDSMSSTWDINSTKINSVITSYGEKFTSAQTTTNNALNAINVNMQSMISQLNKIANTNVKSANSSSASNPQKASVVNNNKNNNNNNNNNNNKNNQNNKSNTISVGGKINANGAQIYDYAGDTSGERQLYRNDPIYKVLKLNGNWLQVRWHKLSSGITGWFKKGDVKAYKTGAKNILNSQIAWTQENGKEFIVRPSDGAILTPLAKGDSVLNANASTNIWNMANSPAEFIKDNLGISGTGVPNSNSQNSYVQNFENIVFSLPNVRNYEELLSSLQKDPKFDKLIKAMTIDQIAGKSSLAKGKALR